MNSSSRRLSASMSLPRHLVLDDVRVAIEVRVVEVDATSVGRERDAQKPSLALGLRLIS